MEKEFDEISEPSTEEVVEENQEEPTEEPQEEPTVSEDDKTPTPSAPKSDERTVPYDRFKKINEELKRLKSQKPQVVNSALDVEDYIDISASLEGLDQREKTYLAREHKLSGKALPEIRESEDFKLWQSAYRDKVEKEKLTLAPSNKQAEGDRPSTFSEKLARAKTIEEKEKLLSEAGLYKTPRPRADRVEIGGTR